CGGESQRRQLRIDRLLQTRDLHIALAQHGLEGLDVVGKNARAGHAGSLRANGEVYNAELGRAVRVGGRQSMPSSSIDSCAGLRQMAPLSACGQMKRPFSSRFINRHSPSPLHHSTLSKSPRLPRNTNTCPEYGSCSRTVCPLAARLLNPERMSVTPAASHTRVPAGRPITTTLSGKPTRFAGRPNPVALRSA